MYGPPPVGKLDRLRLEGLHQCIRPLGGAEAPGHDGYPHASVLLKLSASKSRFLNQAWDAVDDRLAIRMIGNIGAAFAALYAVQAGIWITDAELGGLIGALPAESALVILDTCEASGADNAIVSSPSLPKLEEVAVMASSRAHQIDFADLTSATFTRNLVEAMRARVPTLHEAFLLAQKETAAEAALRCEGAVASGSAGEDCTPQDAELVDPSGITQRIRLGNM